MFKSIIIGTALLATAVPGVASAAIIFNLNNVVMSDGSTLTGSLTTSDNLMTLQSFDIFSQTKSSAFGNLTGYEYAPAGASLISWNPFQGLTAFFTTPSGSLQLYLTTTLTTAGGTLASSSAETQYGKGFRYVSGGSLVAQQAAAVPEPATWMTMILGLGAVGAALRYRRKVTVRYVI